MAVALDASGTGYGTRYASVTSVSYTGLTTTIATTTTNGAIVVCIINEVGSPGASTVVWDSAGANQSFTQIGQSADSGGNYYITYWGLVGPTTYGNKTISVTQTNAPPTTQVIAYSFTGVSQTGGTSSFGNFASNAPASASTTATVTCTSAANNMVLAAALVTSNGSGNLSAPTQTLLFDDNTNQVWGAQYASGASSITSAWTISASYTYVAVAVNIIANGAASVSITAISRVRVYGKGAVVGKITASSKSESASTTRGTLSGSMKVYGTAGTGTKAIGGSRGTVIAKSLAGINALAQSAFAGRIAGSARSTAAYTGRGGLSGRVTASSRAGLNSKSFGTAAGVISLPSAAIAGFKATARGATIGVIKAAAFAASSAKGSGNASGVISVLAYGLTGAKTAARSAMVGVIKAAATARTGAASKVSPLGQVIALARSVAYAKAGGSASGKIVVSAVTRAATTINGNASGGISLLVYAVTSITTRAAGAMTGSIRLAAASRSSTESFGGSFGRLSMASISKVASSARSALTATTSIIANGFAGSRVSSQGSVVGTVKMGVISRAKTSGQASSIGRIFAAAATASKTKSLGSGVGVVKLTVAAVAGIRTWAKSSPSLKAIVALPSPGRLLAAVSARSRTLYVWSARFRTGQPQFPRTRTQTAPPGA